MSPYTIQKFAVLLFACCATAAADHRPDAAWSWHVISAGADESRLSVYQRDRLIGIYNIACDLTDAAEGNSLDGNASINLVEPDSNPQGLLVVGCNVGAHSQQISIFDLQSKSKQPVFSVTGSYVASWELQDGELWISYDEPCDLGPSVDCPDGFATKYIQYPDAAAPDAAVDTQAN